VSPYRSALDVWAQKTGLVPDQEMNQAMRVGVVLERPVLEKLYAPGRVDSLAFPGLIQSAIEPWIAATPDALGLAVGSLDRVVECKVVGSRQGARWLDEEQGAEAIPPEVLIQVQWQMLCSAKEIADVAALLGTEFRVYRVEADRGLQENLVVLARRFWEQVQTKTAPEITAEHADRARDLIALLYPKQKREDLQEFDARTRELAEAYIEAREAEKTAKEEKERVGAMLCSLIGDGVGFKSADLRATWKAGEGGSVKWKEVALEAGATSEQIAAHTGEPSRKLDVRKLTRR